MHFVVLWSHRPYHDQKLDPRGKLLDMGLPKKTLSKSDIVSQRINHLLFINGHTTRKRLAFRMGVPVPTIGSKMVGRTRWNVDEVDELAKIFGVSLSYMFGYEPIETAEPLEHEIPAFKETGISRVVAGAGFEPTTSGL